MKHCVSFMFLVLAGCQYLTPGKLSSVQPTSLQPRAGNVYLIRGWIGVFSAGIDSLGEKLNDRGMRAVVYQDDQWRELAEQISKEYRGKDNDAEPLVLVGHSYGADDVVRVARKLEKENVHVDLLVTLDPVTPPEVPPNVRHCVNLYQSNGVIDYLPFLRGVPLRAEEQIPDQLVNSDVREDRRDLLEPFTNHFNIEKKKKVHDEVIRVISEVCPPRPQWVARRTTPSEMPGLAGSGDNSAAVTAGATLRPDTSSSLSAGNGGGPNSPRGN